MSRRARLLVPAAADVAAFDWTQDARAGTAEARAAAAAVAPAFPRPVAAAATPAAAPVAGPTGAPTPPTPGRSATDIINDEGLLAEHQARLAALEREAFTKGYAQGERAGLEAGGKRAEAMLRRIGQTIEELSGLRQTLIHETEREMVQLALTLARRVVHREVTLDPELAAALAHVALERLGTNTPATVRLQSRGLHRRRPGQRALGRADGHRRARPVDFARRLPGRDRLRQRRRHHRAAVRRAEPGPVRRRSLVHPRPRRSCVALELPRCRRSGQSHSAHRARRPLGRPAGRVARPARPGGGAVRAAAVERPPPGARSGRLPRRLRAERAARHDRRHPAR